MMSIENELSHFLSSIVNRIDILEYSSKLTLCDDYKSSETVEIFVSLGGDTRTPVGTNIINIVTFMLIDSIIDKKNPSLVGSDYTKKYREMTTDNQVSCILKECFRIIRLIRNAIIHDTNSITKKYVDEKIIIKDLDGQEKEHTSQRVEYHIHMVNKKRPESLVVRSECFEYLRYIVWLSAQSNDLSGYSLLMLTNAYYRLCNSIISLNDIFGSELTSYHPNVIIKSFDRRVVLNAKIIEVEKNLKLKRKEYPPYYFVDYYYANSDGRYLIPFESFINCIDDDTFIINDFKRFRVSDWFYNHYLSGLKIS